MIRDKHILKFYLRGLLPGNNNQLMKLSVEELLSLKRFKFT